jgi:hypothetical protein
MEVVWLTQELEIGVSDALGISLLEVHARYFWDSDIGSELVKKWNFRDVIENHLGLEGMKPRISMEFYMPHMIVMPRWHQK